jgi:hypothetical protein
MKERNIGRSGQRQASGSAISTISNGGEND